ncbi:MAG: Zn-ribbon domain-containing OB-fold protein [Candidatus Hodarchaeota archaeon]
MTTADFNFLYPKISASTKKYWEGLKNRQLLAQKCKECEEVFFPPRARCPECLSNQFKWIELSGKGELYSWSEIFMPPLAFGTSYVLGIIDLEEKVGRIITRIEVQPEELKIGMKVEIDYVDVTKDLTLCIFKPL